MPAYYRSSFDEFIAEEFIAEEPPAVVGQLHINYEKDGFAEQYLTQTRAWAELVALLQAELQTVVKQVSGAGCWVILLEFPLYRLQRRIDIIVLTTSIVVIEAKVGEDRFLSSDERQKAGKIASGIDYPIRLTRSLTAARAWLRHTTWGQRRCGLVASSGARRLRADGLGEVLSATDGMEIAHWYLNPPGDIRASYALEVPANEYTCQGLELDFVTICWGGNFVRHKDGHEWLYRRLNGNQWRVVTDPSRRRFIENAYRLLLTRAREGLMIWIPVGDVKDNTREPGLLDATAEYLLSCGAREHTQLD